MPDLVSAAFVTIIGFSLWLTASAFLSPGGQGEGDDGNELPNGEGGVSGSRTETALPVLQTVLAALIGTITVLLPLLASAEILGLAVGFGAQKVVENVISGVSYLA